MKPVLVTILLTIQIGKAQGKGIFLFNKLSQISKWKKDKANQETEVQISCEES